MAKSSKSMPAGGKHMMPGMPPKGTPMPMKGKMMMPDMPPKGMPMKATAKKKK